MQEHIREGTSFLMVTDTPMVHKNGKVFAFGPVVMELDVFSQLFDRITWIGFDYSDRINDKSMVPVPSNIQCVVLQKSGGNGFWKKIQVLLNTPKMFWTVLNQVKKHHVIHTRSPSSPAFLGALVSPVFRSKIWWHKYAGNWAQQDPPFFYGLQRSWLTQVKWSKVTINGHWPGQPNHSISFENPCLTKTDREEGRNVLSKKAFNAPWKICFVGRIEEEKGVGRMIEALAESLDAMGIGEVLIVGAGKDERRFRQQVKELDLPIRFLGTLSRKEVFKLYIECHFIMLPSIASEGFPKVLAEAANFGCLPITSTVASIPQYIRDGEEGFLWDPEYDSFNAYIKNLCKRIEDTDLNHMAEKSYAMAGLFTFERYLHRIHREIIN